MTARVYIYIYIYICSEFSRFLFVRFCARGEVKLRGTRTGWRVSTWQFYASEGDFCRTKLGGGGGGGGGGGICTGAARPFCRVIWSSFCEFVFRPDCSNQSESRERAIQWNIIAKSGYINERLYTRALYFSKIK